MYNGSTLIGKVELFTMPRLISFVCISVLVCSSIEAARILAVFPTPSISHQVAFRPLTQELARRGHEVVVITTDPAFPKGQAPANLTEIDVHDVSYDIWRKFLESNRNGKADDISKQIEALIETSFNVFEKQVSAVPEVRDIIENQNIAFDLLLVEALARYALAFSHVFKVPVIAVSSFGAALDNYDVMGAPTHPILYPLLINTRLFDLSLWEKANLYFRYYYAMEIYRKAEIEENARLRRIFGEDMPVLSELKSNIGMLFLNIHTLWEGNRPVPPGVIHIGGIHQKPEKELPQDLKQYLDSSVHGVIYLSFGTNVDTSILPEDKIRAIIKVFSELPYDVLWKWNQDELPGRSKNIRISKWFPQADLLRHAKVKLFITQGGLQSTDETITAGVPVIGIPMLADQFFNTEMYEHHGIGKKILLNDLNEEILKNIIKTVIEDKTYRENVVRLRTLMYDQPMSSLERAVWWTEHVLRHGTRHLRAPAANMGAFEYYELQLVLTVLAIATAVILLGSFILYKILRLVLVPSVVQKVKLS